MTSQSLRESVLAFMTSNPTAWRIKALAASSASACNAWGSSSRSSMPKASSYPVPSGLPAGSPRRSIASRRPSRR